MMQCRHSSSTISPHNNRVSLEMHSEAVIELVGISKMYFCHWESPGVSVRMWRVNLEASISGEYQTLGGHSGRPWE